MEKHEEKLESSSCEDVKRQMLGLLINWNPRVVSLFVEQLKLQSKSPTWMPDDYVITSEALLMTAITDYLKSAGSNQSFGWSYIGPNTGVQSLKVFSAIAVIQLDSFMQEMMRAVHRAAPTGDDDYKFLASLAVTSDKDGIAQPLSTTCA